MAVDDSYTKSLLHFDGNLTDESGKTWTAYGTAATSTAQFKFGSRSLYLDGASYIATAQSSDFNFANDHFTVDFWYYGSWTNNCGLLSCLNSGGTRTGFNIYPYSGLIRFRKYYDGTNSEVNIGNIPSLNAWHHVALVRKGTGATDLGIAIDGAFTWVANSGAIADPSGGVVVGRSFNDYDDYYSSGYIDELRISKGIARWTSNFTPPTAPYGPTILPPKKNIIHPSLLSTSIGQK